MESDNKPTTEIVPLSTIRVETALSRYPVHRLARRGSIDITIKEGGRSGVQTSWEVDYSKKHGQPGPLAYKLDTLIINRKIEEATRPIPRILKLGSLKDLCRQLGMSETGGNTNQIKKALYQNAFAGITTKTRFKGGDGSEQTLEAGFNRYSVVFTGEKLPDGRKADGVYIVLNDVFIGVINGAMTRPLDYDYLKSLPPAPQRFYELLSFQMYAALKYDRPRAKLTYSEFCAHAPLTRHFDWEGVRCQLNKIHRPHFESGYILKVDYQDTTDREGNLDWIMNYQPGPKAREEFRAFTKRGGPSVLEIAPLMPPAAPAPHVGELERELISRGITDSVAAELVEEHGEEKIRAQIERLDWLTAKKPEKVDDPAAYLVVSIKNDYAPPKGFISKAEQQRRSEAKQAKQRQESEERRIKQAEDARGRKQAAQVASYRNSRSPDELAQLEADAIAEAGEEARVSLAEPAMKQFRKTLISRLIDEHIARSIQAGQIVAEPA